VSLIVRVLQLIIICHQQQNLPTNNRHIDTTFRQQSTTDGTNHHQPGGRLPGWGWGWGGLVTPEMSPTGGLLFVVVAMESFWQSLAAKNDFSWHESKLRERRILEGIRE
jgi:hypothetical protein